MKKLGLLIFTSLLFSCSDQSLCDCVEAGDEVNRISATFFERVPTEAGEDSLRVAKERRDELCADFQDMMPKELHEKAAECSSLEINPEQ